MAPIEGVIRDGHISVVVMYGSEGVADDTNLRRAY